MSETYMTAERRAAEKIVRDTIKEDGAFYKALLTLARLDKTKVEDTEDKILIMRSLRMLHSAQEVNKGKSLDHARI